MRQQGGGQAWSAVRCRRVEQEEMQHKQQHKQVEFESLLRVLLHIL